MIALMLILEGLGLGFLLYLINGAYITAKDKKEKMGHGNRGEGAPCRYFLRDHGCNSAIINIKKENAYERLRSII